MLLDAIMKKGSNEFEFECDEIVRALCMEIPVAVVLQLPRTYSDIGFTDILLYFPESNNLIVYDCNRELSKFSIKKIADINDGYGDRKKVKKYQYAVNISPFLTPSDDGIYKYFIKFATVGERVLEIRLRYIHEHNDRPKEWVELWYYNDSRWRCKEPELLGRWDYFISEKDDKRILNWITTQGEELKENDEVPHINGYHEEHDYDDGG